MINIYVIGKYKYRCLYDIEKDFLKRIKRFNKINIIELKQIKNQDINIIKKLETNQIIKYINNSFFNIILDIKGKSFNSLKFSKIFLNNKDINFFIGGPYGFDKEILKPINKLEYISFSNLTFTHNFIRIILLEQIFRSYKIINNQNYHY